MRRFSREEKKWTRIYNSVPRGRHCVTMASRTPNYSTSACFTFRPFHPLPLLSSYAPVSSRSIYLEFSKSTSHPLLRARERGTLLRHWVGVTDLCASSTPPTASHGSPIPSISPPLLPVFLHLLRLLRLPLLHRCHRHQPCFHRCHKRYHHHSLARGGIQRKKERKRKRKRKRKSGRPCVVSQ